MKYIKISAILLVASIALASFNINAASSLGIVNVKLGMYSGIWTSASKYKRTNSKHKIYNKNATDNITGGGRAVQSRIREEIGGKYETGCTWISVPKGTTQSWSDPVNYGGHIYDIQIRATKSTFAATTFSGTWTYDD